MNFSPRRINDRIKAKGIGNGKHLERVTYGLGKLFFDAINRVMVATGHIMKGGTIVDATILDAASSTKNAEKARDPGMHQTKKGNQWRFEMKCHAGVDAGSVRFVGFLVKNAITF